LGTGNEKEDGELVDLSDLIKVVSTKLEELKYDGMDDVTRLLAGL
ncbi:hypothetical protein OGATHE_001500, partial [Ogataea polymorpha]